MAGLGRKVFQPLEFLSSADVNGYLMDQSVMYFASSAARDAALTNPSAGMHSYRADGAVVEVYNGSAWVSANSVGGTITIPGSAISGTVAAVINNSNVVNTLTTVAGTAYSFTSTDQGKTFLFTSSSAVSATIGTATGLSAGQQITLLQDGAGTVTVRTGAGVTLAGRGAAGTAFTMAQYDGASIVCVGSNSYRIIGNVRTA